MRLPTRLKIFFALNRNRVVNLYYSVRDFFFPWNVIKLRGLTRSWHDTDERMEHAIMQLLSDFFDGEQPFHNCEYEKNPSIARHKELLLERREDMDPEKYAAFETLLDILEWHRNGGLRVTGEGVFLAGMTSGQSFDESMALGKAHRDQTDEKLTFVLKHRHLLWT